MQNYAGCVNYGFQHRAEPCVETSVQGLVERGAIGRYPGSLGPDRRSEFVEEFLYLGHHETATGTRYPLGSTGLKEYLIHTWDLPQQIVLRRCAHEGISA